jgi:hypothetical protein
VGVSDLKSSESLEITWNWISTYEITKVLILESIWKFIIAP